MESHGVWKPWSLEALEANLDLGLIFFIFFNVRLLSVLRDHSFFSSPPQRLMTSDFEGFLYQILYITLFSYLNS